MVTSEVPPVAAAVKAVEGFHVTDENVMMVEKLLGSLG